MQQMTHLIAALPAGDVEAGSGQLDRQVLQEQRRQGQTVGQRGQEMVSPKTVRAWSFVRL